MGNAMAASQFPYLGAATATSLSVGRDGSDHSSSINFSAVTGIHFFDTSNLITPPSMPILACFSSRNTGHPRLLLL